MATADTPLVTGTVAQRPDALAHIVATPAGRWLVPSLTDLFFVALFIWLFVAGGDGWHALLLDGDVGWHIRTGEYILDHHAVPKTDMFSFTRPGTPWFAWEWGSDVLLGAAHRMVGLKAVVLGAGIIIVLWPVTMLRQALWRGSNAWPALALTLLGTGAASIHFLARPHVFTLLFTTVSVWVIEADLRRPSRRVWWLVPLCAVWTNLHGGFLVLLVLLAVASVGSVPAGWSAVRRYAVLAMACAAVSLLNPYGWGLHTHIVEYLRSDWIRNVVQEFRAPDFRSENLLQYEFLLLSGVIASGWLFMRRRFVNALWILAFAHLSLGSVRHVPVFIAVATPILAEVATEWLSWLSGRSARGSSIRILEGLGTEIVRGFRRTSIWGGAFLAGFILMASPGQWPRDFPEVHFPVKTVHAYQSLLAHSRVLTDDQWADYLIYLSYPDQRVFADGRSDFYGPEVGNDYIRTTQGDYRWRRTLDRYRVDAVLAPVAWPLTTILKTDPAWHLVSDDGKAILFTRSAPFSK